MLLGQSVFQSVLTRLKEDQKDEDETEPAKADFRIRGLGAGFVTPDGRPEAAEADIGAYFDFLADWPGAERSTGTAGDDAATAPSTEQPVISEQTEPVMPAHLARLSEAEIAEDLALSPQETEASLNEKRRHFAKDNHPDRVAPAFRDNATTRMKIANLMIDRAIKELFWRR
ncbi:hypothetical protein [Neorhizobium sp. NCHU2750]|uniref:hypothetical protein n=1 Tax=Neorhizobium sp. NCHU2750 TaxID=1825976 RepID=UPI000E75F082|nr:hypothetical protein NCHU2750_25160 [Neorhizobium sp. NCHU2750]